jgi:hypothetical protein
MSANDTAEADTTIRVRLDSYELDSGPRLIAADCHRNGDGEVMIERVLDMPGDEKGRAYVIESELQASEGLEALLADYKAQAADLGCVPMSRAAIDESSTAERGSARRSHECRGGALRVCACGPRRCDGPHARQPRSAEAKTLQAHGIVDPRVLVSSLLAGDYPQACARAGTAAAGRGGAACDSKRRDRPRPDRGVI